MTTDPSFAWTALLVLGAIHGVNPAMGWLFAVSLGLQERSRGAVWRALGPLALGHAVAILAAVGAAALVGQVIPLGVLKWVVAGLLVSFGVAQLIRHRHPRWGGMRMGGRDLTIWSFLMASAHGAGLMAVPFLLRTAVPVPAGGTEGHGAHVARLAGSAVPDWIPGLLGSGLHTASYLLVTGLLAAVVYEWIGLRILRRAWLNLDVLWAAALVITGLLTPLL